MGAAAVKRVLVLFPKDWDRDALCALSFRGRYEFFHEGFDLARFPQNMALLRFDVRRFIDAIVERYRNRRIDGVFSNNEHFGALIAAVVAKRLGLPGTNPRAVIDCQHKFYSRVLQRRVAPEATPRFAAFTYALRDSKEIGLPFPCFVKPVKATYSVLARPVADFTDLRRHLHFRPLEKMLLAKLVKPFNDLLRSYTDYALDARYMIAEEILHGVQVNVDGFVHGGEPTILGIVDEVMYPGTRAFMRFEYPSRLPPDVLERIASLSRRLIAGIGYDFGFFNIELIYDPASAHIGIVEINPRLASQLASLYRKVDGDDPYEHLLALSVGERPVRRRVRGEFNAAASFVLRRFDGRPVRHVPSRDTIRSVGQTFPDARVMLYLKKGAGLAREMKWLGSYRYAVLNLGGDSALDLQERFARISRQLAFDAE